METPSDNLMEGASSLSISPQLFSSSWQLPQPTKPLAHQSTLLPMTEVPSSGELRGLIQDISLVPKVCKKLPGKSIVSARTESSPADSTPEDLVLSSLFHKISLGTETSIDRPTSKTKSSPAHTNSPSLMRRHKVSRIKPTCNLKKTHPGSEGMRFLRSHKYQPNSHRRSRSLPRDMDAEMMDLANILEASFSGQAREVDTAGPTEKQGLAPIEEVSEEEDVMEM